MSKANPLVAYLASGAHRKGEPLRVGDAEIPASDHTHALGQLREGRPELHAVLCAYARPSSIKRTLQSIGSELGLTRNGAWWRLRSASRLVLTCVQNS